MTRRSNPKPKPSLGSAQPAGPSHLPWELAELFLADPDLDPLDRLIWEEDVRQEREERDRRLREAWERASPAQRRAVEARAVAELVEDGGTVTVNHGPTCDRVTGKGARCTCAPDADVQRQQEKARGADTIALLRLRETLRAEEPE